jgi:hypothetical protein
MISRGMGVLVALFLHNLLGLLLYNEEIFPSNEPNNCFNHYQNSNTINWNVKPTTLWSEIMKLWSEIASCEIYHITV